MRRLIIAFFASLLALAPGSEAEASADGLIVNIISHSLENGAGKQVDVAIIKEELETYGHHVNLCDYHIVNEIPSADINIFLAQFVPQWVKKATLNWFVPNPEFCEVKEKELKKFDLVICKTRQTEKIFAPLSREIFYLGFTSIDHFSSKKGKRFDHCLHVAGKSRMKGTSGILRTWKAHPELPNLIVLQHSTMMPMPSLRNCRVVSERISDTDLIKLQNQSGIHLCPSKTEGFGHSIMEGMSVESVVVTIDAPPMNEFIQDKRCLVRCSSSAKMRYATTFSLDEKDLARKINELQKLPKEELAAIGKANREEFLRRNALFKENFRLLMEMAREKL